MLRLQNLGNVETMTSSLNELWKEEQVGSNLKKNVAYC